MSQSAHRRGVACPPAVALEEVVAGETAPAYLLQHLKECQDCGAYVEQVRTEIAAHAAQLPAELFMRKLDKRRREEPARPLGGNWRWLSAGIGMLSAAALVFVVSVRESDDEVRLKGSPLQVFLKRKGETNAQAATPDARVSAGDSVRFGYSAPSSGYLAIFNVDSTGTVTLFAPYKGIDPLVVQPGSAGPIEGTIVLDDSPGAEWIVAVFDRSLFSVSDMSQRLQRFDRLSGKANLACGTCRVDTFRLVKRE